MALTKLSPGEQAAIKKVIEEDVPELSQDEEDAIDEAFTKDGEMFPQRWYNAGHGSPQERILMKGGKMLEPHNGYYVVHTPEELTTLRSVLAGRVWKENLSQDDPDLVCTRRGCDMRSRSTQAFQNHISRNHPQN